MGIDDRGYMRERYRARQGQAGASTWWNDRKSRRELGSNEKAVPLGSASWIGGGGSGTGSGGGWFDAADRHNNPCQRRGNWPIMNGAKQMLCRDWPMVHCDTACFRGAPPALAHEAGGEDVLWGDQESDYGDD